MSNEQRRSEPAALAAPVNPPSTSTVEAQLTAALAALAQSQAQIAALMERQADFNEKNAIRRRKTMGEYLQEKPRKRLLHEVYQNGQLVNPAGLSFDTIKLLDTLAQGKFADGLVDVVRVTDGVDGINSRIHIIYNNKTLEQRMQFYMRFPTFTKLVNDIAAEMAARGIKPVYDKVADPIEEITEVATIASVKPKP